MRNAASITWLALAIVATSSSAGEPAHANAPGPARAEPELSAQMTPFYVSAIVSNMKVSMIYRPDSAVQRRVHSLLVQEVRPKSSAEKAGLIAGMEIVEIEGVSIDGLYDDELDNLLHRPLGEFLNLKVTPVRHNASSRTFVVRIPLPKPPEASVAATAETKPTVTPPSKPTAETKK